MIDSSKIIDDPSELFTQFDPNLYFSDPKLDDTYLTSNLNWYTIVEQSVPTDQEAFWKTIVCGIDSSTYNKYYYHCYYYYYYYICF